MARSGDATPYRRRYLTAWVARRRHRTAGHRAAPTRFVVHPGYDNVDGGVDLGPPVNDIAPMVLDRDVIRVAVVPLLSTDELARLTEGTRATVAG